MNPRRPLHPLRSRRGSLLIVAMLLCAIIGISLASYINLGRNSLNIANRALYNNAAMNLAENGLEEAMYAINQRAADSSYAYSTDGWTLVGTSDQRQKWTDIEFDQNARGTLRVYIINALGSASPVILARSTITLGGQASAPIEKWVEVRLRRTSRWANGLVAKDTIRFNGTNASVDSWNSDPDNDPATAPIPYSAGVARDNGSVGSISVSVNAVLVQNADIWGYAATGGALPQVGPGGRVGPFHTPAGTMDMSRVSTDFSASFDAVAAPSAYTYTNVGTLSTSKVLPDDFPAATMQADGKYYLECASIGGSNKVYTVAAGKKVVLKVTNTTGNCVDIKGGSGALNVSTGATLEIYAAADVNIGGQGAMNGGTTNGTANQPINLQIFGTKTSGTQNFTVAGNGLLSAVVYAPNASLTINGNGDVSGSFVANDITSVGNAAFHYDESLANFGGSSPFRVTRWNEVTSAADRAAITVLGF